jgi:hypothetical protein
MEYKNGENKPTLILPNLQNIKNDAATTMRENQNRKGIDARTPAMTDDPLASRLETSQPQAQVSNLAAAAAAYAPAAAATSGSIGRTG